jgi:hypothetical protein
MKKLQSLLAVALCAGILTAVAAHASPQGFGTAVRVKGLASYSLGDNQWHPLQQGKYLPVGATVRTGHNGEADIVLGKEIQMPQSAWQPDRISYAPDAPVRGLINYKPDADQNIIRVMPDTVVAIEKLTIVDTGADTVSDTELNLKQGKIFASVKKLNAASQYLIKLPNGIAGVRGTLFSISADGSISCYESQGGGVLLSLVGKDGKAATYNVLPGQAFNPNGGISSLTSEMMDALDKVFKALRTTYFQVCDFSYDHTRCYVSPGQGGNGQGGNQGGNGGGNGQGGNGGGGNGGGGNGGGGNGGGGNGGGGGGNGGGN